MTDLNDYTIHDLINPDVREALEAVGAFAGDYSRSLVQAQMAKSSKHMIDGIHLLTCHHDECDYYNEENDEDTWNQPEHVEFTDKAVEIMNICGFGPGQWVDILGQYLKVLEAIGGPGPTQKLLKLLNFTELTND